MQTLVLKCFKAKMFHGFGSNAFWVNNSNVKVISQG